MPGSALRSKRRQGSGVICDGATLLQCQAGFRPTRIAGSLRDDGGTAFCALTADPDPRCVGVDTYCDGNMVVICSHGFATKRITCAGRSTCVPYPPQVPQTPNSRRRLPMSLLAELWRRSVNTPTHWHAGCLPEDPRFVDSLTMPLVERIWNEVRIRWVEILEIRMSSLDVAKRSSSTSCGRRSQRSDSSLAPPGSCALR